MFATTDPKLRPVTYLKPRRFTALCVAVFAALALCGLIGTSAASAASSWWHLGSAARPTNIVPGAAKDEVQQITVEAGSAFELKVAGKGVSLEGKEPFWESEQKPIGGFYPEATRENLQKALEETAYGAGNVEVTGGPGGSGTPLTITSVGKDADVSVAPLEVPLALGKVEAKILTKGRPDGQIVVTASNLGDAPVNGEASAVKILDKLPPHLQALSVQALAGNKEVAQGPVSCAMQEGGEAVDCSYEGTLPAFTQIELRIGVIVGAGSSSSEINEVNVSGGEAPSVTIQRPIAIGGETKFGIENYELTPEVEGGAGDTQAGSHPFQLTTTLALNQNANGEPAALTKDTSFKWPPGLIGNPTAVAQCTLGEFLKFRGQEFVNACPPQSAVGVAMITINEPGELLGPEEPDEISTPLFNLEPEKGEPARFGFLAPGTPVLIDASVRTGSDYGITVKTDNISQTAGLVKVEVTTWGTPGEQVHDGVRGNGCLRDDAEAEHRPCHPLEEQHPSAFLALPTSCPKNPVTHEPEALRSTLEADSWVQPHPVEPVSATTFMGPFDGCDQIPFKPSLTVTPDGTAGSTPTGLTTDVHVPQEESLSPNGIAEGDVKDINVALPPGLALNPAAADGLAACTEAQIGYEGAAADGTDLFSPSEPSCPDASKVGNATIKTPVLANPLTGYVYLAAPQNFTFTGAPQENPFQALVAMYLVAKDPVSGVLVKLPGSVALSATGQITATFKDTPQAPFEDAALEFYGGERAPLATPARCEPYATNAAFTPWSLQEGGVPAQGSASFNIESGPNGSPCPGAALPFNASLTSGTTNNNAGSFSQLSTTLSRPDGDQNIQSVTLRYPPGLSGLLSGVKLCGEAQANAGTCGPESEIGETIVSVGLGGDPFTVTGGKVYITEKYQGAPFGLSIVNPAKAGPFDLQEGRPVVVRAKIEVDPSTAALTITTDGSGEHAIPTIIEGIPLQIKHVNVNITRNGFTFNPTNCNPAKITGEITSAKESPTSPAVSSPVSVPFQVTNCGALKFSPKFSVSTSGKTSKSLGASLTAKVSEPAGSLGTQANLARVKVELPKALPSRLTTLQRACTSRTFEENPAKCPPESDIGHAKVITPLVPVPLEGPAIFVSHGGEAFPSLIIVLQGYGVTIDLVGTTFISKAGITSSTFKAVPDQPFSTFELTLPQGKFSALAANGDLCKQASKLKMPVEFLSQSGVPLRFTTRIGVTGCKKLTRSQQLKAALAVCRKQDKKDKARRESCEQAARKRFRPVKKKTKK